VAAGEGPHFERLFDSPLFAMPRAEGDAWAAFLVIRGAVVPGTPIGVPESWSAWEGHYLFSPGPAAVDETTAQELAQQVYAWLDDAFGKAPSSFGGRALLWLPKSKLPDPAIEPSRVAVPVFTQGGGGSLSANFNPEVGGQLTLSVPGQVLVKPEAEALALRGVGTIAIRFVDSEFPSCGLGVAPNEARLPFTGPYAGALTLEGSLELDRALAAFGTGLHYGHGLATGGTVAQSFPLLPATGTIPYRGSVDPIDPLNREAASRPEAGRLRTLLAPLLAAEAGKALPSSLRAADGRAVGLLPLGGDEGPDGLPAADAGALVFEDVGPGGTAGWVYLAPAGDWAPVVEEKPGDPTAEAELLCGLFGLERLPLRPLGPAGVTDVLRFLPGRPAFAPVFPFPPTSLVDPDETTAKLTNALRTSWVSVVARDGRRSRYLAQPNASPLFANPSPGRDEDGEEEGGAEVLPWHGPAAELAQGPPLPLAPYAGLLDPPGGFPVAELGPFESQVLAAERSRIMLPPTIAAARRRLAAEGADEAEETVTATTPQGFLAEMRGASFTRVTLARSAAGTPDLAFTSPTPELQALLQSNQLMGVITDPTHLGGFDNQADLAEWKLTAAIGQGSTPSDPRNVMLLKFCHGALVDRLASPATWTAPQLFSKFGSGGSEPASLTALSAWLQTYCAEAISQAEDGNELYADFARVVRDAEWQGILVLRAEVGVEGLPDQIRGLAAGLDLSAFDAHHFGATVTPVGSAGGKLQIEGDSSLFGLIDYQLPQFRQNLAAKASPDLPLPLPTDGPFGFKVLQLQARFANSALADFRSRVQLTADELFGSPVRAAYSGQVAVPATAVVLSGSYQRQGTTSTYVFEDRATTTFTLDSDVLRAVAFERVQFNTLSAPPGEAGTLRSRFLVWGALDFAALRGAELGSGRFDAFSYGSAATATEAELGVGLAFSNLQIDLTSPAATPGAVSFALDPANLAFDLAACEARTESLAATFSLQIEGVLLAAAGKRPADYGYLSVSMGTPTAEFEGPWFGLVFKLTMGTPGALVAGAGFDSRMLLGWAATSRIGAEAPAAFCGLQLPGAAPGAKLLSLQGVLKVSIGSLALQREEVSGRPGVHAFVLRLGNVGLTFLGLAKLPPGATINFFLFGDPTGTGSLGWYAAYTKPKDAAAHEGELLEPVR
jgi:hypothetical protein